MNLPFLDGDVPRSTSYGVLFINLFDLLECPVMLMTLILVIRFFTAKLVRQRYSIKIRKAF